MVPPDAAEKSVVEEAVADTSIGMIFICRHLSPINCADISHDEPSSTCNFASATKSSMRKARTPLVTAATTASTASAYKTALETSQEWERNLRGGGGGGFGKRSSKKNIKNKSSTANQRMAAAMRLDTSNLEPDGRPSVGTMTAQVLHFLSIPNYNFVIVGVYAESVFGWCGQ